ncbi:similar to Zygosaccharomyces bailii BN860_12706g1_1 hypothetical protein [Zygosaccharomyces bailii CLIB 213] [Maudiozyma barnettii]|uniref:Uncharacterized protein n=1 Tax=Maudiozyma barnettii TaxID=61262 RepID=A0A8H2ZIR6_9SACH|nr:similar to Zygosaccharomyces bailii BN860_12706g1_1 hypothetical protein [Zygosaccharomyces bailii CLIB 213] [Kazachstania barnettii]CAB4257229.1 similar to Zygosaccharomyces bailii BN860_12706g1_1 hypothetical protein [Zygosaccharomyces bailii CLIB 213] [Kazachstania barnettii]CAD1779599.1 similar to Zygosaccharomyces bailii BN860_12706g1_1 hypothetical protein [Zygosaccharomyces bailii CLIB 213] [Kazachstania barnettii]
MIDNRSEEMQQLTMAETVKQLTSALTQPFLEIVDEITEDFMYPRGLTTSPAKLMLNEESLLPEHVVKDDTYKFGHPIIFELIALRIKITKLRALDVKEFTTVDNGFVGSNAQKRLVDIELIMYHIHKKLNHDRLVLSRFRIYNGILVASEPQFESVFEMFGTLDVLVGYLTKSSQVKGSVTEQVLEFCDNAGQLYKDTLLSSSGYKDYCEFQQEQNVGKSLAKLSIEDQALYTFLNDRKALLHITNRKIF